VPGRVVFEQRKRPDGLGTLSGLFCLCLPGERGEKKAREFRTPWLFASVAIRGNFCAVVIIEVATVPAVIP